MRELQNKDDDDDFVAGLELLFEKDGEVTEFAIGISAPEGSRDGFVFYCRVYVSPTEPMRKIIGSDSLQAMILSLDFLKKRLLFYRDELGFNIYYAEVAEGVELCSSESVFPIEEYFDCLLPKEEK